MAVLYEVRLTVNDPAIQDDFLKWLADHVEEMVALPEFESAEVVRDEDPSAIRYRCLYWLDTREALENYFEHHAERMRADGKKRFGDGFSAERQISIAL